MLVTRPESPATSGAGERAAITADRLQRRVAELSGWLAELTSPAPRRVREKSEPARRGVTSHSFRAPAS